MPTPAEGAPPELSAEERLKKIELLCVQCRLPTLPGQHVSLPEVMNEIYQLSRGHEVVTVRWFGVVTEVPLSAKLVDRREGPSNWECTACVTPQAAADAAMAMLGDLRAWLNTVTTSTYPRERA